MKRVDRKFHASDMLTLSLSAEHLRKFLPVSRLPNFNAVKTMLKGMLAAKTTAFLAGTEVTLNS